MADEKEIVTEEPLVEVKDNTSDDWNQALDKAIEVEKEETPKEVKESKSETTTPIEEPATENIEKVVEESVIDPPAEFTTKAKEAFRKAPREVQEEISRVHRERTSEFSRLQSRAQSEYGEISEIAKAAIPYAKAMGVEKASAKDLAEALMLVYELKRDPVSGINQILTLTGKTIDDLKIEDPNALKFDEKISPLKMEIEELKRERQKEVVDRQGHLIGEIVNDLQSVVDDAGQQIYSDLTNDEKGLKLAGEIGSCLASDEFRRMVERRIPGAGPRELVIEAYRWNGGRQQVTSSSQQSAKSPQEAINRQRRAAASVPSRGTAGTKSKPKLGSFDSALDAALDELGV